jgi:hypothetical protein
MIRAELAGQPVAQAGMLARQQDASTTTTSGAETRDETPYLPLRLTDVRAGAA